MARRYSRDNRGRFASGGTGATARGGRLKTASGNKRATQTTKAAAAKPSGTVAGKVKRNPAAAGKIGQQAKAAAPKAAQAVTKKRIAVPSLKTNTDLGRRGVVSMSARAKVIRSQNVKSLATQKGKEVLERIQSAGARRGGRETKYNAPGSAGAKRIAKTAATQSRAGAFAQQQVYSKGGGAYRGQRPEFNWKRSRATAKPAAAKATAKPRTQKERWASRSTMLSSAAAKNEAKAKRMFDATTKTDTAFNTQPGRLPGRARMNAQTERSFKLQEKAAQQRSRAANLERMANTNKGDAAKRRATRADAIKTSHKGLKKGDTVEGVLYGAREVVKVNAKSVTVKGGVKNFTIPWEQIKPKQ
jgi:hypothetical protein